MTPEAQHKRERQFTEIVEANRRLIYKVCYMFSTGRDHFDDLYQEVLANIWQGLASFRGDSSPSTWIYRIALNTCVSFYRRNVRQSVDSVSIDNIPDMEAPDNSRSEQLREMYRLIGGLPAMDKAIIMLWLDEKSYDEIAEVTGLTRNTVATRLRRIKQKLAEQNEK